MLESQASNNSTLSLFSDLEEKVNKLEKVVINIKTLMSLQKDDTDNQIS